MKAGGLILLLAGCVLVRGTAYASISHPAPQQATGNSAAAASDHSSDTQHATPATDGNGRKEPTASDDRVGLRVSDKIHPHRRTSVTKPNRPKQVQRSRERSKPQSVTKVDQPSLTKPIAGAGKIANHRTPPIRPAAGISGDQFENGRRHGATPPVIGGPTNTRRNTATLSGTNLNRKRMN